MRIAVNAQTLVKNQMEGLGWFSYETLKRIVNAHPEHEFTFIFGKGIDESFLFADNVKAINIGPPFFRPITWWFKFRFLLPKYVNRNKFDLYLSPDGWSSKRIKAKSVIVIHDINFVHFPQFLKKSVRYYYHKFFPQWINHAKRIATVSNYSKKDIVTTYEADYQKIDVLYNGASPVYQPVNDTIKSEIKNKYTNGNDFFIFVGALHPRKNVINLFKSFDKFKISDKNNIKLVIVGERYYWSKETNEVYQNLSFKDDVIFTGRLDQKVLKDVLGSALALTYVSLFEGFGIPLVEAMNCGVPIITSNTTSMPEIAADAALIVDPYSVDEIVQAMHKLVDNEHLRKQLIASGNQRKLDFSWDKTAEKLWQTIEKVIYEK